MVVGLVGYVRTPSGLRSVTSIWAGHIDDSFKRRLYKHWYVFVICFMRNCAKLTNL